MKQRVPVHPISCSPSTLNSLCFLSLNHLSRLDRMILSGHFVMDLNLNSLVQDICQGNLFSFMLLCETMQCWHAPVNVSQSRFLRLHGTLHQERQIHTFTCLLHFLYHITDYYVFYHEITSRSIYQYRSPGPNCSEVIWLDFGYQIGSNLENRLLKRKKRILKSD